MNLKQLYTCVLCHGRPYSCVGMLCKALSFRDRNCRWTLALPASWLQPADVSESFKLLFLAVLRSGIFKSFGRLSLCALPSVQALGCNRTSNIALIGCSQSGKTTTLSKLLAGGLLAGQPPSEQTLDPQLDLPLECLKGLPEGYDQRSRCGWQNHPLMRAGSTTHT